MDVVLVSQDRDLYKLCREILAGIPGHHGTISAVGIEDADIGADLYIWDFHPNILLEDQTDRSPSKHLFLVQRKDLSEFHKRTLASDINILLKPVTRATMTAFLGLAASTHEEKVSAASSLRAERDEIFQCLIQTNLRLQEYDQDRTNFLTRAVHDFRAPLTALNGYCGLLLDEQMGSLNDNQKEVIRRMQHSAKRLARMASAMFELSVGRQVKRRPDLQKCDLRECLDQALHEIMPLANEKRVTITADLDPCEQDLYFEAGQIEQVLINILDNACRFTPKAGSIEIRGYPFFWDRRTALSAVTVKTENRQRAVHGPNGYRIDIRDSGSAIPQHHMERIFEEYTSYAGGRDRSCGGLGLAICRLIMTQHDGHVWAENTNSGPVFSFVLPIHRFDPTLAVGRMQKTG
jgi:signal transduction histidine kinase